MPKITGMDNRPVQVGGKSATERASGKSGSSSGVPVATAAKVHLTDSAVQLAALEKALAQVPDVDMDRVAQIRSSLGSGSYTVDSRKIAGKLLELERSLAAAESDKRS